MSAKTDSELDAFEAGRREREAATLRAANKTLRIENRELQKALAIAEKGHSIRRDFAGLRFEAPQFARARQRAGKATDRRALLHYDLSDWHFDEVVDPAQIDGYNAYSRAIATMRLEKWVEKAIAVPRYYLAGYDVEGVVFALLGDMFSGQIHPELAETNEAPLVAGLRYWLPRMQSALVAVVDELKVKSAHVVCVVGNHSRLSHKPRAKFRAEDNFDYLLGEMLALLLKDDARFTFHVPTSADCRESYYGFLVGYTHGDQFRGGSGWGGMMSPIMRGIDKKVRRDIVIAEPAHQTRMGHWHHYMPGTDFAVNGAGKGYDEWAYVSNLPPEPPMQAFSVFTPEHGNTLNAPIYVGDRKREGW